LVLCSTFLSETDLSNNIRRIKSPHAKTFKKRAVLAAVVLLAGIFMVIYLETQPRIVPEQELLTDVENIETLRTQFNRDAGKTRLIILVSPA
jgi:hypothetical protein